MASLFADENFPFPAITELRRLGHEVMTSAEAGLKNQSIPDEEILAIANEKKMAVLTLNRVDFVHLHKKNPDHYGIVVCTSDRIFLALAHRIHHELSTKGELRGQLIRICRPQKPNA